MSDHSIDIVLRFIQQGDTKAAVAELEKIKVAAAQVGEQGGKAYADHMEHQMDHVEHHLKTHLANFVGQLAGAGGLGRLAVLGGAGSSAAVGFAVFEKVVESVKEKMEELKETSEALHKLTEGGSFTREEAERLHHYAEGLETAERKTADWLATMTELNRFGADEKIIQPMTRHVKDLADKFGLDLKAATAIATAELHGNFKALEDLGIIIDNTAKQEDRLRQAMTRTREGGSRDFAALAESAKATAREFAALREEAEKANKAVEEAAGATDRFATARNKLNEADTHLRTEGVDLEVEQGKITPTEAANKKEEIKRRAAQVRHDSEQADRAQKAGIEQGGIDQETAGIDKRKIDLENLEKYVAAMGVRRERAAAWEQAKKELADAENPVNPGVELGAEDYKAQAEAVQRAKDRVKAALAGFSEQDAVVDSFVPKEFRDQGLDILRDKLNKSKGPDGELKKLDKEAQKRLEEHRKKLGSIHEEIDRADDAFGAEIKAIEAEAALARQRIVNTDQKKYEAYNAAIGKAAASGADAPELPTELKQYFQNGRLIAPKDFHPTAPAGPTRFAPGPYGQPSYEHFDDEPNERGKQIHDLRRPRPSLNQNPREHFDTEGAVSALDKNTGSVERLTAAIISNMQAQDRRIDDLTTYISKNRPVG